jgi:DNA-binding transcriptional regulator YbjK
MTGAARRPRGDRTRGAILDATLELIGAGGPRAVTYRSVAERAGVALGQMTFHYPTHADLLTAAFERHQGQLRHDARALPIAQLAAMSGEERTAVVVEFLRAMATTNRLRYLAEFELSLEMARDEDVRARLTPATTVTYEMAVELLRAAHSPSPEADGMIVSAAMEGLLLAWLAQPDRAHERRIERAISRLLELVIPARENAGPI